MYIVRNFSVDLTKRIRQHSQTDSKPKLNSNLLLKTKQNKTTHNYLFLGVLIYEWDKFTP